jgi:hypothetical protein
LLAAKSNKTYFILPNISLKSIFFIFLFLLAILTVTIGHDNKAFAGATVTVPISWCAVNGSRAASNDPNIPNPYGGIDHSTDEVLWRRHERATDHIYNNNPLNGINQALISFRSAINDALHTSLNFPKIDDPNPAGTEGDLNRVANLGQEYRDMLLACKNEWANLSVVHPGVVSGIFALNVRLTVNDAGQITDTIGTGRCARNALNECDPYDGHLYVVDNSFMLYGISSGLPSPEPWMNKDEFDQSVSHELGHTLNLDHRNGDILALMNTNQQHNGPNGRVSNFKIYPAEITEMRQTALDYIPGTYMDPDNKIIQGNAVQTIQVDKVKENKALKPYEDIALSSVTLDKRKNTVNFGQELYGLLPEKTKLQNQSKAEYWTLVDLDNNKNTGGNKNMLMNISFPLTNTSGIDLAIHERVSNINLTNGNNINGNAWILKDNNVMVLGSNDLRFSLQTASIHHGDRAGEMEQVSENEIPLYDTIYARLNNTDLVKLDSPFSIQSFVISNGTVVDKLDYKENEPRFLELSQPFFPVCYANQNGTAGQNVTVNATGLLPMSNVHALLGTRLVANGTTDASGNSTIKFNVPHDTTAGLHLMTIGVDKTALTADCQIKVQGQGKNVQN